MKTKYVALGVLALGLAGCTSDTSPGPATGFLLVVTEATGTNIPLDSIIHIEGLESTTIRTDGAQGFSRQLPPGPRLVELEVPGNNCTTENNPRTVQIETGPNEETFVTTCV
jgi:hypothetical protein